MLIPNPDLENLRVRMGVDVPANPLDKTTTGTLQPDLLRVLTEDGFMFSLLDPDSPKAQATLEEHLQDGHQVIALIRRAENNNLHWVVLSGLSEDGLEVVDSLWQPTRRPTAESRP